MSKFKQYRRKKIAELRPVSEKEIANKSLLTLLEVSISQADLSNGSPKVGDMIARNPKNHNDRWLVAKEYFEDNFECIEGEVTFSTTGTTSHEYVLNIGDDNFYELVKERANIYEAIDGEREYQDEKWKDFDDSKNNPSDWVIYMEKHLAQCREAIYNSHDMRMFCDELRKVAALAVACAENIGMSTRIKK